MAAFLIALIDQDAEEKKALLLNALQAEFPQHRFQIVPDPPMVEESSIYPMLAQPQAVTPDEAIADSVMPPDVPVEVREAFHKLLAENCGTEREC